MGINQRIMFVDKILISSMLNKIDAQNLGSAHKIISRDDKCSQ